MCRDFKDETKIVKITIANVPVSLARELNRISKNKIGESRQKFLRRMLFKIADDYK